MSATTEVPKDETVTPAIAQATRGGGMNDSTEEVGRAVLVSCAYKPSRRN